MKIILKSFNAVSGEDILVCQTFIKLYNGPFKLTTDLYTKKFHGIIFMYQLQATGDLDVSSPLEKTHQLARTHMTFQQASQNRNQQDVKDSEKKTPLELENENIF